MPLRIETAAKVLAAQPVPASSRRLTRCALVASTADDRPAMKPTEEIEITPSMIKAGYVAYLTERQRVEDGDDEDRRIAFTSIFREMWQARQMR